MNEFFGAEFFILFGVSILMTVLGCAGMYYTKHYQLESPPHKLGCFIAFLFGIYLVAYCSFTGLHQIFAKSDSRICTHCQKEIEDEGAAYCPDCGFEIEVEECTCDNCIEARTTEDN